MDIGSKTGFPSSNLSNFTPHPFVLDGIKCNSMEGFLQSLKFENTSIQIEVCKLVGLKAKRRGSKRNKRWKQTQKLWWQGNEINRDSEQYQQLLNRAFEAISENTKFTNALLATGNATLTHSIGKRKKQDTVLTAQEFCSRLMKIRKSMRDQIKNK